MRMRSLESRIVMAVLGLILVVQLASFVVIRTARLGGDELTILRPNTPLTLACRIAARIEIWPGCMRWVSIWRSASHLR